MGLKRCEAGGTGVEEDWVGEDNWKTVKKRVKRREREIVTLLR